MNKAIISAASLVLTAGLLGGLTGTAALWQDTETVSLQATKNVNTRNDASALGDLTGDSGFKIQIGSNIREHYSNKARVYENPADIDLGVSVKAGKTYISQPSFIFGYKSNNTESPFSSGHITLTLPSGLSGQWWIQNADKPTCNTNGVLFFRYFDYSVSLSTAADTFGTSQTQKRICFKITNQNTTDTNVVLKLKTVMG